MTVKKTARKRAAKTRGASLARSTTGSSLSGAPLRVPSERGPWTFCASPSVLYCQGGHVVPRLAKAWHTPGLNGNGKDRGRGEGYLAQMLTEGWIQIPHDIECIAWGETRTAADVEISTYLECHTGLRGMVEADYHTDAWTRPRQIGHLTRWERDTEGWNDFLRRCMTLIWPGELDPIQLELATAKPLRRLDQTTGRDTYRHIKDREAILRNLPADVVPAKYRELHAELMATTS